MIKKKNTHVPIIHFNRAYIGKNLPLKLHPHASPWLPTKVAMYHKMSIMEHIYNSDPIRL